MDSLSIKKPQNECFLHLNYVLNGTFRLLQGVSVHLKFEFFSIFPWGW